MNTIMRAAMPTAAFGLLFLALRRSNRQQGRINGALSRAVLTQAESDLAIRATLQDMAAEMDRQVAAQWQRIGTIAKVTAEISGEVYGGQRGIVEAPSKDVEAPEEAVTADA